MARENKLTINDDLQRDGDKSLGVYKIMEIKLHSTVETQEEYSFLFIGKVCVDFPNKITNGFQSRECDFYGHITVKTDFDNNITSMEIDDTITLTS